MEAASLTRMRGRFISGVPRLLVAAELLLLLGLAHRWLYVTTTRLYLEDSTGQAAAARSSVARQRFQVIGADVVPQILIDGEAALHFPLQRGRASTLHVRPGGAGSFEIWTLEDGRRRLLESGNVRPGSQETLADDRAGEVVVGLPVGATELGLESRGPIVWSDLRLVRDLRAGPSLALLALCLLGSAALPHLHPRWRSSPLSAGRRELVLRTALVASASLAGLAMGEAGLRLVGLRLPQAVLLPQRDLGLVLPDERWAASERFQMRHPANLRTACEWSRGDVVEMGFVPAFGDGRPRRFPYVTDGEGFPNPTTRTDIHVAALGDSFTDPMMLPRERAWPARLETLLGRSVQNYGTAGFGPQQELYVLEDYALRHGPRLTIVAFFAGNDVFNAASFSEFERTRAIPTPAGWRLKRVFARFDTLYLMSVLAAASRSDTHAGTSLLGEVFADSPEASPETRPSFANGVFEVKSGGSMLRFALMPPYLHTLTMSRADFEAFPGWRSTRETLERMNADCRAAGSALVVLFVPFKSQVMLPLLQRRFSDGDLRRHLESYFPGEPVAMDLVRLRRNRLAQNELMAELCAVEGIPLLDLTSQLEEEVDRGVDPYLPDDSHWAAAGHELAARALNAFLRQRGLQ